MIQPPSPQQLLKHLLYTDLKQQQCIENPKNIDAIRSVSMKESLKKQITDFQQTKAEYIVLLQQKEGLASTLKELLNFRQSIDYDHKYKRLKFDHYQFPYRNHIKIKEELYQQRTLNVDKRRKIKQLEEEIKRLEKKNQMKRLEKENLDIWKVGNVKSNQINNDCDEDFWLKRIEKMKKLYLNGDEEYRRTKIKHDYNLMVQKTACCCTIGKVCPLCSDLNLLQTRKQTTGYARQALISPRYSSIYKKSYKF